MPLAPGRSSERAIFVSSVMFFSLSSAMVIGHLRRIGIIRAGSKNCSGEFDQIKAGRRGWLLSSPPLCLNKMFRLRQYRLPFRACDPIQYFVHGFLDSGIRLMELPGSLRGKLAKHITVPQSV